MANPNGRFRVVDFPSRAPGSDFFTGKTAGPFLDTGRDLSIGVIDRGRIYLSKSTVREMAEAFGLFDDLIEAPVEDTNTTEYDRGYLDAVRENHGDTLRRIVDDLGFAVGQLTAVVGVEPEDVEGGEGETAGEDAPPVEGTLDTSESTGGEDDEPAGGDSAPEPKPRSKRGRIDVPVATGDGAGHRL